MTEVIVGKLRPLRDNILIRPLKWEPSKLLEVVRHGRPLRGEVVAVGPGTHERKYKRDHAGQKVSYKLAKHFRRMEVKVGDTVEIGGLNAFDGLGYCFTELNVNGETLLMCQEADVCGIVDG